MQTGTNAGTSWIDVLAGVRTAIRKYPAYRMLESPLLSPAEFPLFLILFLKCYEQVAVNAAAFIKEDFQVEFVRAVFHRDGNLVCT